MDHFDWLEYLDSCASTNTWAIAQSEKLTHGSVVFTRQQTAGRGQRGRTWIAPTGVLTASFVVDRVPVKHLAGFSLAVGLAVIHAVEELVPLLQNLLRLKWSNDVLIQERKLAGILCETSISSRSEVARVIVGIGLNRCADFTQTPLTRAISLHEVTKDVPDEVLLLERLRHHLLQMSDRISQSGLGSLHAELQGRDILCDRILTIDLAGQEITGQAIGIDINGRLLLKFPDQSVRAFTSGHILRWN